MKNEITIAMIGTIMLFALTGCADNADAAGVPGTSVQGNAPAAPAMQFPGEEASSADGNTPAPAAQSSGGEASSADGNTPAAPAAQSPGEEASSADENASGAISHPSSVETAGASAPKPETHNRSSSEDSNTEESGFEENNPRSSGEISAESGEGGEVPGALIPAVMIEGTIYYLSQGYPIPDKEVNSDQASYTGSEVSLGTYPEKDGESNYAPMGTPYVKYEDGYVLKLEEYGWSLFLTWEDRLAEE